MTVLSEVAKALRDDIFQRLHHVLPGKIEAYDPSTQKCEVTPLIREVFQDATITLPKLTDIPVVWPRGGGAFVTLPLSKGDTVAIHIAGRSLDKWLAEGGLVTPDDTRKFSIGDAVVYPGLVPFSNNIDAHASNVVVGFESGGQIHIKSDGSVALGSESPSDFVALAQKVLDELNKIATAYNTHTHPVPSLGTSGAPSATFTAASVASTKVSSD